MTEQTRKIAPPSVNPETERVWAGASQGRLLIGRCHTCGKAHWYPRAICPFCFGEDVELEESPGRGVIYTYTVMRRVPEPYALAYVKLEEGPTMMTNIVDCDLDALSIGQTVMVTFKPSDGGPAVPMFRP
jgi:uncharacterized protein